MAISYLLLTCELGKEQAILDKINKVEGIIFADKLYGAYDLLVKIEANDSVALGEKINWNVKNIEGIKNTMTLNRKEE